MAEETFALFLDVMGVRRKLARDLADLDYAMNECREMFEQFHRDLEETFNQEMELMATLRRFAAPRFVAEFSDSAYVIADDAAVVIRAAVVMMRKALRHEYALRGGIGYGSFSHETSGSSVRRDQQVWSTSSFFGTAVIRAYEAERSPALGLRVFVHPDAMKSLSHDDVRVSGTTSLPIEEASVTGMDEVRLWNSLIAPYATRRLMEFRDKQRLNERARAHYDATVRAYERFSRIEADLPYDPLTAWVFAMPSPVVPTG